MSLEDETHKEKLIKELHEVINLGDNFPKFIEVKRLLKKFKSDNSKIRTELFPSRGSIPAKYFPLNGEEESPILALRDDLQANQL